MGDKIESKKAAARAKVSTVPGHLGVIADDAQAVQIADEIGYPVMIKASAGGGGKGMRIAHSRDEVAGGLCPRPLGGQILVRRRPGVHREIHHRSAPYRDPGARRQARQRDLSRRARMLDPAPQPEGRRGGAEPAARSRRPAPPWASRRSRWPRRCGYDSAGTVEFVAGQDKSFYFLEMNTRLQVEHPVTELVTGIDLVEQMIRVAAGEQLAIAQGDVKLHGWAVETRIYAEDPIATSCPRSAGSRATARRPRRRAAASPCATTPASPRAARSRSITIR